MNTESLFGKDNIIRQTKSQIINMQFYSLLCILSKFYSVFMAFSRHMLVQNRQLARFSSFFLVLCLLSCQCLLIAPTHASASILRDTELERGLGEIIHDMAEKAGFPQSVKVRIVNDPTYNAFVVGGRTVYVHTGLLLQARSAEEILGVIAHEIGHLAAGHVPIRSEDIKNAGIANALAAVAAAAVAVSGSNDVAIGVLMGGTDQSRRNYMSASRNDEAAADGWAVKLLDWPTLCAAWQASVPYRKTDSQNIIKVILAHGTDCLFLKTTCLHHLTVMPNCLLILKSGL